MGIFDIFKSSQKEELREKAAYDINSPALLELIRSGTTGAAGIGTDQAARISTVYACVKVLSESISTIPCKLYRIEGDARTAQPDNRMFSLVNKSPNDYQTASEFWSWVTASIALNGNAFVYLVKTSSGNVVEMRPISSNSVSVHVDAQSRVSYSVTVAASGGGEKTLYFGPKDLLHFKGMTLDGVNGVSPIQYNSSLLAGARDAVIHGNSILTNGAAPRGILTTDGILSEDAYERIKASWNENHAGVNNAGKVSIMEAGLDFKSVQLSPADIALLDTRKYSRSEIAGMYRIPPHLIGDLEKATYTNISEQQLSFYRDTLSPWLVQFEQRLNHTLLKTSAQAFRFDTSEFLRGDLKTEVESYKPLLEMAVLNPNEVRARLGMNPREGGDEYVSATNNLTFGDEDPKAPKTEDPEKEDE